MSGPLLVGVVNPSALPVTCLVNLMMMNMDSPILTALGTDHLRHLPTSAVILETM